MRKAAEHLAAFSIYQIFQETYAPGSFTNRKS
jgi:hypothetical protein